MAGESSENEAKTVINLEDEDLFDLKCLIKTSGIYISAHSEIGKRQLLAFTTRHADIGLFYQSDINRLPIIKRIPWFRAANQTIAAFCFDPTGTWLLTVSVDGSLYIVPALALVDDHNVSDHKWSVTDVTHLPIIDHQSSFSRPCALSWWQGVTQNSQTGIIGTEEGEVIFINLENGQWINSTRVDGSISRLDICQDNSLEIVSLLVTTKTQQQWRMILEQRSNDSIYSVNCVTNKTSQRFERRYPQPRSRLQGLKELSVGKLALLAQKVAESRTKNVLNFTHSRRDSGSSSGNEEFSAESSPKTSKGQKNNLVFEPLHEDIFLSPQYIRQGQHLYTAYCTSTNQVAIHGTNLSIVPFHMNKMPHVCRDILLTQKLFFVTSSTRKSLLVISRILSETRIGDESDFKLESIVGRFNFEDSHEYILNIYRATDSKAIENHSRDESKVLPGRIEDINIEIPPVDSCLIVTNFCIYKLVLREPLLKIFVSLALKRKGDIEKAARIGVVFGLNVPQLFEAAGDIHLTNGRFSEAAHLYKLARCRLLKVVLKTAAIGHTAKLLECINRCMSPLAVTELTTTTRIHLSNLTVFLYSELILRASPNEANLLYKDFLTFLSKNTFYDERWVVDVVGQTCLWKVLHHLATQRGLYAQVLEALIKTIQPYSSSSQSLMSPLNTKYGLLICLSEPTLLQSILANPNLARSHMAFVLSNLSDLQTFVLQRLVTLYDPTNSVFRPLLVRYRSRRRTTSHSSQSSQCDSLDSSDMLEENGSLVEEVLETFIFIILTLISKRSPTLKHNPMLVNRLNLPSIEMKIAELRPNVDFKRRQLSAGYGLVALIRNGSVYTWGSTMQGCLGTGPTISQYGPPTAINMFKNLEMEVLSVSCGHCHTLAVTNNGVYAWGGSQYGQLGLGRLLQAPNPEMITSLAQEVIVDAVAGQYHSVALSMDGRLFTWGWGVHGQLGHGNTERKNVPTVVQSLLGIIIRTIAAGHAHTLALSVDGTVYAFGCNIFGQLGTGNNFKSSIPLSVSLLPEPITDIATSYFHNLALGASNKLYTWGSSPQALRLQTQTQKKNKLAEFHAAAVKYAESFDELDSQVENAKDLLIDSEDIDSNDKLSSIEKLAIKTVNERKIWNCPNVPKSISLRDINLGLLEETQTHLRPTIVNTTLVNGRIVQISTGCHHSALLTKDGTVYTWGRNLDGQIGNGTRKDGPIPAPLTYNPVSVFAQVPPRSTSTSSSSSSSSAEESPDKKLIINSRDNNHDSKRDPINRVIKAVRVCCGCEFTVAIQPGGTVLAWGSYNIAQLGRPPTTKESGNEKLVLIKSSKRVVRLPHGNHVVQDTPIQVPNIPAPIITYQSYDVTPLAGRIRPLTLIEKSAGEITLHYILEQFNGLYDASKIVEKCDELGNYQARAKLALLEQNYSISLAYQLKTLNPENYKTALTSSASENSSAESKKVVEKVRENTELFDKQVEKNLVDTLEESESKKKIKMAISKSLDSINTIEQQELHTFDCQGGSEELCEDTKSEDISLDLTEDAFDNDNGSQTRQTMNKKDDANEDNDKITINNNNNNSALNQSQVMSPNFDAVIQDASNIIRFYINEVDDSMQKVISQVLLTIFDFWIKNAFPMAALETLLLENVNKLFYPLGLLIFCQNQVNEDMDTNKNGLESKNYAIIDHVSTKFCIQICTLLLNHIDERKCALEYVELFSMLTAKNYGPSLIGYGLKENNKSIEKMMEGIISTISSKASDPRPFIHIKDPEKVSNFLDNDEDTIVFTCGHHYPLSIYQSEVIPNMEAELLMTQPISLPCTAQKLGNMLLGNNNKTEIMCPRCVPRALQTAAKNLMDR